MFDTFINLLFVVNYIQQTNYIWREDTYLYQKHVTRVIDLVLAYVLLLQVNNKNLLSILTDSSELVHPKYLYFI